MSRRITYFNLSKMSEDEVAQLMDSISSAEDTGDESNDGDFDSDDDVADPDFMCKEDELMIAQCLLESSELSNAIDMSINVSGMDDTLQSASFSQMPSAAIASSSPTATLGLSSHMTSVLTSSPITLQPSTSSSQIPSTSGVTTDAVTVSAQQPSQSRQRKRKRGPNQILELQLEEDGPEPHILTSGEFSGAANQMKNDCQEFKNIRWKKKICRCTSTKLYSAARHSYQLN